MSHYASQMLVDGKISVVMPAFNESANILSNLREVVQTFFALHQDFEIILVDDGSPDDTHIFASQILLEYPKFVKIVRYDTNEGKGNALIAGVNEACGDYVVFLDADMDLHPRQLPLFFETMRNSGADAVIGSKWHPLSKIDYPPLRKVYSTGYFLLVRLLFGLPLRDTQTGLKVFRSAMLHDVFPRVLAKRFAFDIEVLAIAHTRGYKLVDAPVTLEFQRTIGRLNMRTVWSVFCDTLAIFYRLRILRYYDRPQAEGQSVASTGVHLTGQAMRGSSRNQDTGSTKI